MDIKNNKNLSLYDEEIPTFPHLEINNTPPRLGILPRKTYNWIDDSNIIECYKCKTIFTFFYRKHHCRGCGRIFCYNCCNYSILCNDNCMSKCGLINPDNYLDECIKYNSNMVFYQKSCESCYTIYLNIKKVSSIILVIQLLPLQIGDIYKLRTLNKTWYEACNIYLSKIREIQYNLPNFKYTKYEKNFLSYNIDNILDHNKLLCRFIKSFDWYDYPKLSQKIISKLYSKLYENIYNTLETCHYDSDYPSNYPSKEKSDTYRNEKCNNNKCKIFMCDHKCENKMSIEDILDILTSVKYGKIREYVLNLFENSYDSSNIKTYAPLLIYSLKYDDDGNEVKNYLIKEAIYNVQFQHQLLCELIIYTRLPNYNKIYTETYEKLLEIIDSYGDINGINNLLYFINNIEILNNKDTNKDIYKDIRLRFPNYICMEYVNYDYIAGLIP